MWRIGVATLTAFGTLAGHASTQDPATLLVTGARVRVWSTPYELRAQTATVRWLRGDTLLVRIAGLRDGQSESTVRDLDFVLPNVDSLEVQVTPDGSAEGRGALKGF